MMWQLRKNSQQCECFSSIPSLGFRDRSTSYYYRLTYTWWILADCRTFANQIAAYSTEILSWERDVRNPLTRLWLLRVGRSCWKSFLFCLTKLTIFTVAEKTSFCISWQQSFYIQIFQPVPSTTPTVSVFLRILDYFRDIPITRCLFHNWAIIRFWHMIENNQF